MNKSLKSSQKKLNVIIILVFAYLSTAIHAADDGSKLKSLLKQINKVKTDINQKEKQHVSVGQQLENLRKKIKTLEADYRATVKKLKQQKQILAKLNTDQNQQRRKLQDAQKKFSAQIVAAYQITPSNYLQTISNKSSQADSPVFLNYHKYIFTARLEQMHDIKITLQRIESNKQRIRKQAKILENLENKQKKQQGGLMQAQQERSKIFGLLKNEITAQNQKLKELISAKRNLEKLITSLSSRKIVNISPELMTQLCHDFVWPTKGTIAIHFGSPIAQSSWSWSGIIIAAPEGQEVRAVSSGKVVYADWFNGYGLLLIVDHGNGYMSLYGYNNDFRKKLYDEVAAGEVVAIVGKSDYEKSGLYFAIRYNSEPVNPERWCQEHL